MIEFGRRIGQIDPEGLYRSAQGQDRHHRGPRESELARQAARPGRKRPDHHDAVRTGIGHHPASQKLGLIEKVDWAAVAPAEMFPEAKNEYGFGYQYFSTIMAWRKGAKEPKNFTEFFDTKAFPGKRCLPDFPHYCLPFALQAAGVPIDKLFPLDVDLAFKKLNEIKKDVSVWWKAGAASSPAATRISIGKKTG